MFNLGKLALDIEANSAEFIGAMSLVEKTVNQLGQKISRAGYFVTAGLTVPLAGLAAVSTKSFASFDQAMTQSLAIMGEVSSVLRDDMASAARELATETTFSAKEIGEAYYFLASAGLNAQQSLEGIPIVTKFAQAGMFDMSRATDLLTDAQSALGLTIRNNTVKNMEEMIHVSDVLVKANTLANASVEQFSKALTTRAGAELKIANKTIEEGVAVLAVMADQGIKAADAGTKFGIVMRDLKTKAIEFSGAFKEAGIAVFETDGSMRNLADIVDDISNLMGELSVQQQRATFSMLGFSDRSLATLSTLIGTGDQIRKFEAELNNAAGTTDEVANKQLKSLNAQFDIFLSKLTNVAIEIGGKLAPTLIDLMNSIDPVIDFVMRMVDHFASLPIGVQQAALAFVALLAAIGPFLAILGQIVQGFGALVPFITTAGAALSGFAAGPVIAAAGAMAGLVGWLALAADAWSSTTLDPISQEIKILEESLTEAGKEVKRFESETLVGYRDRLREAVKETEGLSDVVAKKLTESMKDSIPFFYRFTEAGERWLSIADKIANPPGGKEALFGWMQKGLNEQQKQIVLARKAYEEYQKTITNTQVESTTDKFAKLEDSIKRVGEASKTDAWDKLDQQLKKGKEEADAAAEASAEYAKELEEAVQSLHERARADEIAAKAADIYARSRGEATAADKEFLKNIKASEERMMEAAEKIRKAAESQIQAWYTFLNKMHIDDLTAALEDKEFRLGTWDAQQAAGAPNPTIFSGEMETPDIGKTIPELADMGDRAKQTAARITELKEKLHQLKAEINIGAKERIPEYNEALAELGKLTGETTKKTDDMKRMMRQVSTIINDFAKEVAGGFIDWIIGSDRGDFNQKLQEQADALKQELDAAESALSESLQERTQEYEDYVEETRQKQEDIRIAQEERLAKELENLRDNLEKRIRSYEEFVEDTSRKLSRLSEDLEEALREEREDTARTIEDKTRKRDRELEDDKKRHDRRISDLQRSLQEELAKGDKADKQRLASIRESIRRENEDFTEAQKRKREDFEREIKEQREALAEFEEDQRQRYERQTEDARIAFERRTEEHQRYIEETAQKEIDLTNELREEGEKRISDLDAALAEETAEFEQFKMDALAEYEELSESINGELEKIKESHRTMFGDLGGMFKNFAVSAANAVTRLVTEYLAGMLVGTVKDLISTHLPNLSKSFTDLFGNVGGGDIGGMVGGIFKNLTKALSGLMEGIMGVAGGLADIAIGVIGLFQNARQEDTLNAIELNTRQTKEALVGDGDKNNQRIIGELFKISENTKWTLGQSELHTQTLWNILDVLKDGGIVGEGTSGDGTSGGVFGSMLSVLEEIRDTLSAGISVNVGEIGGKKIPSSIANQATTPSSGSSDDGGGGLLGLPSRGRGDLRTRYGGETPTGAVFDPDVRNPRGRGLGRMPTRAELEAMGQYSIFSLFGTTGPEDARFRLDQTSGGINEDSPFVQNMRRLQEYAESIVGTAGSPMFGEGNAIFRDIRAFQQVSLDRLTEISINTDFMRSSLDTLAMKEPSLQVKVFLGENELADVLIDTLLERVQEGLVNNDSITAF